MGIKIDSRLASVLDVEAASVNDLRQYLLGSDFDFALIRELFVSGRFELNFYLDESELGGAIVIRGQEDGCELVLDVSELNVLVMGMAIHINILAELDLSPEYSIDELRIRLGLLCVADYYYKSTNQEFKQKDDVIRLIRDFTDEINRREKLCNEAEDIGDFSAEMLQILLYEGSYDFGVINDLVINKRLKLNFDVVKKIEFAEEFVKEVIIEAYNGEMKIITLSPFDNYLFIPMILEVMGSVKFDGGLVEEALDYWEKAREYYVQAGDQAELINFETRQIKKGLLPIFNLDLSDSSDFS